MIDEAAGMDQPCAVCCMDVADCCCPECPNCGEQGNPKCYKEHGLKLNKEQVTNRVNCRIFQLNLQIADEQQYLGYLAITGQTEWDISETRDPFG
jgi:hypothetical protein